MIHKITKWPVVWGTTYNNAVEFLELARKVSRATNDDLHKANTKIGKLEYSLRSESALNDTLSEERDLAVKEQKSLKKKLSDNAIPTRDQKSGRFKKRA